jgi:four helix bundle protein
LRPFRDLEVHKQAHALTLRVYAVTRTFPREEQFGLTSQLRRAATSVPANIAEGSARSTDRDFRQFLYNALGSSAELEYLLVLANDLGYISSDDHDSLQESVSAIKRMLVAFISRLSGEEQPWARRTSPTRPLANSQQPTANSPDGVRP